MLKNFKKQAEAVQPLAGAILLGSNFLEIRLEEHTAGYRKNLKIRGEYTELFG